MPYWHAPYTKPLALIKKIIMKNIILIGTISFVTLLAISKSFAQNSVVLRHCQDNDVNKEETYYLVNTEGNRKRLENMTSLGSDPFFYNGLKFMYDTKTEKMGCINEQGVWAIKPQYDYKLYSQFVDGIAVVSVDGKFGYIDTAGNYVLQPEYGNAFNFTGDISMVDNASWDPDNAGTWQYINKQGVIVGDWSEKLFYYSFKGEIALATNKKSKDGKYGLYSFEEKKWLSDVTYNKGEYLVEFSSMNSSGIDQSIPLFPVEKNNKWGYLGKDGQEDLPFIYEAALPFRDGLSAVKLNGKWGYINENGEIVIEAKYSSAKSFHHGKAFADGAFIDKKGTKIEFTFPKDYKSFWDDIEIDWNDSFIKVVNKGGGWDILNWEGKLIWDGNCDMEEMCFPQGSKTRLKSGISKPIEQINIGEELISYMNGQLVTTIVLEIEKHKLNNNNIIEIYYSVPNQLIASKSNLIYDYSKCLQMTGNHPLLTTKGIKKAENLSSKDILLLYDWTLSAYIEVHIEKISKQHYSTLNVYNLITSEPYYTVEDIVVLIK
ncbi:MAG: hypothetical protein CL846_01925 [Crocinitomicaceae bacterium]|nr:hypothetical protein [Crocinitomicaceae bacterium]|tara:strand:- start:170 stop:1807 length:1638 start_codon:yes stop_codon:yes gene_type:complete